MNRLVVAVLGVVGLLGLLAGPALAQAEPEKKSCCSYGYFTEGKHVARKEFCESSEPFRMPETWIVQVAPSEQRAGDLYAYATVGKRTERVILREVPRVPAEVVKGHECFYGWFNVAKHTERKMLCGIDGNETLCVGMANEQCQAKK
jgi:hypothetical protein